MKPLDIYRKIFHTCFQYNGVVDDLEYQKINEWDSFGHMQLINELEEAFNIKLDDEDIIDFSSFEVGKKILMKYGVLIS